MSLEPSCLLVRAKSFEPKTNEQPLTIERVPAASGEGAAQSSHERARDVKQEGRKLEGAKAIISAAAASKARKLRDAKELAIYSAARSARRARGRCGMGALCDANRKTGKTVKPDRYIACGIPAPCRTYRDEKFQPIVAIKKNRKRDRPVCRSRQSSATVFQVVPQ